MQIKWSNYYFVHLNDLKGNMSILKGHMKAFLKGEIICSLANILLKYHWAEMK
jgi:hypothetical protein